jgi:Toprim-like
MTSHTSANYRKGAAAAQSSSQYGSAGGGTYARTQQQPQQMMKTRGGNAGAVAPSLPMPSQRLQALYSSQLLDGQHSSSSSLDTPTDATASSAARAASQDALRYLTETRGLSVATLRKYGVGLGLYSFYDDSNTWMNAACVTFPWLLSVADVQEQERLRGGCFEWEPPAAVATVATATTPDGNDVAPEETKVNKTKKPKGKKTTTTTTTTKTTEKASTKKVSSSSTEMLKKSTFLTRRIKARAIHNKKHQRLDPPGGGWGLFGFHTVPNNNDDEQPAELVLTEGEYDAMAVYQATGRPAVSLPNGCRSLPVEVLPLLERFDKVYLWMDNDGPGQEGAEIFAKKIGMERCFIVRPTANNVRVVNSKNNHNVNGGDGGGGGSSSSSSSSFDDDDCDDDDDASLAMPKDANEALLMGLDLEAIIRDARLIPHERIATFASMRSEVMHEIRFPEKYVGTPMSSLPALTNIIKGFRRGEMTVLTGPTGSGKVCAGIPVLSLLCVHFGQPIVY